MYGLYQALGYAGLSLMVAAAVVAAFAFVYAACEGGPYLRAFCLVLAAAASAVYWAPRPHIFSFALAAVYGYILHLWRWRGINRLWLLPLLMVAWANLHPGFSIGFILMALTLAGQVVSALAASLTHTCLPAGARHGWRGVAWLSGIGLLSAAAVSVNPAGPSLLAYPFQTVSIGVLQDFIQEWQSPNFHLLEQQVFIWLLLATLGAAAFSRRSVDVTDFVLVSGTAYLALLAGRNIALFGIVAAPVLTRHLDAIIHGLRARYPRWVMPGERATPARLIPMNWIVLAVVGLACALKAAVALDPALNERVRAGSLPVAAAEFIAQTRPAGPIFNSYNWGGYLSWALYGDYLVFVDGRTDLYPDDYLRRYLQVTFGQPGWRDTLERHGIRLVVIETNSVLAAFLRSDTAWMHIYSDDVATVFSRVD
jgi:hypothetical protein